MKSKRGGMGGFQRPCGYVIGPRKFVLDLRGQGHSETQPLLAVYGGGKQIADLCAGYGWLHLPPVNGRK